MSVPDDRVDALYGLPLDQFVPERDALAKALRAEGDRAAADQVRRLPKPTSAAWAVNAAVRAQPEAARALEQSARLLGEAQQELLAGGDPSALREATDRARAAVDALAVAAPAGSAATAEKVRATLHAATVEPDVLAEVTLGRVVGDHVASGFGGLAAGGNAKARATGARDDSRRREKLRRAKEAEAAAESEVAAAQRALEQVESLLAERGAQLREAEGRLKDARRRRERAES